MTGWFGGTPNLRNLQMKALSWRILVGHGSWKCVCFFTWRTLFQKYMFLIVYVLCVSIHLSIFPSFHLLIYSTIQLFIQISKDYIIIYYYTWFYIVTYWIWYMPIVYIHPLVHLQYPSWLPGSILGLWRPSRTRGSLSYRWRSAGEGSEGGEAAKDGIDTLWIPLVIFHRVLLKMAHWPIGPLSNRWFTC